MINEGFREYVNGNMLFWAANVRSNEGYKGTTLPFELMCEPQCISDHFQLNKFSASIYFRVTDRSVLGFLSLCKLHEVVSCAKAS